MFFFSILLPEHMSNMLLFLSSGLFPALFLSLRLFKGLLVLLMSLEVLTGTRTLNVLDISCSSLKARCT